MGWFSNYTGSTIGRKQVMGITGIFLYIFLLIHLAGNFGLLIGAEHFNSYSHLLLHTLKEITLPVEFLLLFIFLAHIVSGIMVTYQNKKAKGIRYTGKSPSRAKTIFSATMAVSGIWLLFYLIVHVAHFRFEVASEVHHVTYNGVEMADKYSLVMGAFSSLLYAAFYVVSMIWVGFHLAHGVQSSIQSMGFNHPKYRTAVMKISKVYAFLISAGFIFIAVWAYMQGMK